MSNSTVSKPAYGEMTAFMAERLKAGKSPGAVCAEAAERFGRTPTNYSARVYQIVQALKEGRNPGMTFYGEERAKPTKKARSDYKSISPEHLQIVERIVNEFTEGNTTRWVAAYKAHPEWKEALSQYPVSTLYASAGRLRTRLKKLSANGQAGHALARQEPVSIAPEPIPASRSLICCPKCGENVERWENLSPLLDLPAHVIERLIKMASSVKTLKAAHL